MKILNKRALFSVLIVSIVILFTACSSDDENVITPKTLEQYKLELSTFISSEKNIVENCVVGYNKGDFKSTTNYDAYKSAYLTALLAAEATLTKPELTIANIIEANKSLAVPGKAFTSSLWISDRRPLNDAIVDAETLNTATLVGTAKGEVAQDAKTAFSTAITEAKTIRGASTTIERQVSAAVTALSEAKLAFTNAIIK